MNQSTKPTLKIKPNDKEQHVLLLVGKLDKLIGSNKDKSSITITILVQLIFHSVLNFGDTNNVFAD